MTSGMDDTSRIIYESDGDGPPPSPASPTRSRSRGPGIAFGVFALVLVVVGGSGYAVSRWLSTTSQEAATAIPADVDLYVGLDAVRLLAEDAEAFYGTVARSVATLEGEPQDGRPLLEQLDESLLEEVGFDFSNDIRPWVGRTTAIGVELPQLDDDPFDYEPEFLGAVEVRDAGAADAFLSKLTAAIEADGTPLETVDFSGALLHESPSERISVGLWGDMFLFGSPTMVRRSIALQEGQSLAGSTEFIELTAKLPADRSLTGYVKTEPPAAGTDGAYPGMFSFAAGAGWPQVTEAAFAGSLRDGDAVLDVVSRMGSDDALAQAFDLTDSGFVDVLGPDTLAFFQFGDVATIWETVSALLFGMTPDADALIAELNAEVGFDVVEELIRPLDRPSGLAVVPSTRGMFALSERVPLGGMVAFGTSQPDRVAASIDRLVAHGERNGVPIMREASGVYSIADGGEVVVVGVIDRWLALGTSADVVETLGGGRPGLTGSPRYLRSVEALPEGRSVQAYVDIAGLVDLFADDPTVREAAAPYRSLVAGSAIEGDIAVATVVLTIDG